MGALLLKKSSGGAAPSCLDTPLSCFRACFFPQNISCTLSLRNCLIGLLVLFNIALSISIAREFESAMAQRPPPHSSYSWIEDDIPDTLHIPNPRPRVAMNLEDSVHFARGAPNASLAWMYSISPTRSLQGDVHYGSADRGLNALVFHELHCLNWVRLALEEEGVPAPGLEEWHMTHCLNMVKDFTLCAADIELERGHIAGRNFDVEKDGGERSCMDVEGLYGYMQEQWEEWDGARRARSKVQPMSSEVH
ncbi:uncharacterized protein BXZ73DRAFT_55016 [Epithele typhae]|uniref:uncharacterized protein n=1 Tax=Epithele typhae TaxID=378194 RepID=UPI0020087AB4|nr:uncharacterized protein BXZ73DRAFT_55016 [Epithele typhae]KAH9914383.1 hypothetical protein BXZ73DRAFT_55016 [Epithele typhae]